MRSQAYRISWLTRDRDETHYVRQQMLINQMKTGVSAEPTATALSQFETVQQQQIEKIAQPVAHKYQIKPIATPTP
jgi:N-acetyl-anhydromuramyl-L-alanine amidase AmpD